MEKKDSKELDFKEEFFKIINDSINDEEEDNFESKEEDEKVIVKDSLGYGPPLDKDPPEIHKKYNKASTAGKGDLTLPTGNSYIIRGFNYLEEKKYDMAIVWLLEAKKDRNYLILALIGLTFAYGIKGEFDEAIKNVDEAMNYKSVNIKLFSKLKDFILLKKNKKDQ